MNTKHKSIIRIENEKFFDNLSKDLVKHGNVKITDLGVFKLRKMKKHDRYVPGNDAVMTIPSHVKVGFVPTKKLKVSVQKYRGK